MADEIALSVSVVINNGFLREQFVPGQIMLDQDTPAAGGYVQSIGTSEETIDFGSCSFPYGGLLILRNLEDAYTIEVGPAIGGTGTAMEVLMKLYPGMLAILPLDPDAQVVAKAYGGSAQLFVRLYPYDQNPGS